jgi:hypothetical protein
MAVALFASVAIGLYFVNQPIQLTLGMSASDVFQKLAHLKAVQVQNGASYTVKVKIGQELSPPTLEPSARDSDSRRYHDWNERESEDSFQLQKPRISIESTTTLDSLLSETSSRSYFLEDPNVTIELNFDDDSLSKILVWNWDGREPNPYHYWGGVEHDQVKSLTFWKDSSKFKADTIKTLMKGK